MQKIEQKNLCISKIIKENNKSMDLNLYEKLKSKDQAV